MGGEIERGREIMQRRRGSSFIIMLSMLHLITYFGMGGMEMLCSIFCLQAGGFWARAVTASLATGFTTTTAPYS